LIRFKSTKGVTTMTEWCHLY